MATEKGSKLKEAFYGSLVGGISAFLINAIVRSLDDKIKDSEAVKIGLPIAKFIGGTYAALGKGMTPMVRGIGVGMSVVSGIESVNHFLPQNFKMSGIGSYGYGDGYYDDPSSLTLNDHTRYISNRTEPTGSYSASNAAM